MSEQAPCPECNHSEDGHYAAAGNVLCESCPCMRSTVSTPPNPKVLDLVAALEESLVRAREERDRRAASSVEQEERK